MGQNILTAAENIYGFDKFKYGTGVGEVVCNILVYQALLAAGYKVPLFATSTLFKGTTITPFAKKYFTPISQASAQALNGPLQVGDIILFQNRKDPTSEHMGIFAGYDSSGHIMFYGSQTSTGPALVDTIDNGNYWYGGTENIVGALRINSPLGTTTAVLSTGTGMTLPGQVTDSSAQYSMGVSSDGTFSVLYSNGTTFTYSNTFQQWIVPDPSGSGNSLVYSRSVTGGNTFGEWIETEQSSNFTTLVGPVMGTIPSESITLTTGNTNPFVTGTNVTSAMPNSANLTMAQAMALAEATGTAITFNDQSATVTTGNCYTCTIDLSAASGSDQTITLTLTGGANNMVVDGNTKEFINFSGGNATITVPAGQDSVTLTLIDGNNVSTADKLNLTATLTPSAGSGQAITSNALAITFNDPNPNAGSSTPPANTINGDLTPINFGTAGSPSYHRDAYGNLINNGTPDPNFSDYLYGDGGNDVVNAGGGDNVVAGMGGNDTINAGTGNDVIVGGSIYASNESYVPEPTSVGTGPVSGQFYQNYGGNGNNVINGGGGQDIIIVGNGNNQIYANTQLTLADALDQQDTATASGQKGDLIAVGDGNNTIVGGAGNDAIFALTGGSGSDVLQGGSGNTLFVAGSDTISLFVRDRCKAANDFEWMMAA